MLDCEHFTRSVSISVIICSDWAIFVQIQAMHCGYGPVDLIGCLQIQERKLSVTAKTGKQLILILF